MQLRSEKRAEKSLANGFLENLIQIVLLFLDLGPVMCAPFRKKKISKKVKRVEKLFIVKT